ncbi:MFS transporter [Williamsia sterculiae]|uniref:Drug resistance transporter, EmrB/QacA subfamily n=1 Tax=Williamsia sterculiae TaxID=1344003 RepID=A0A1N7CMZ9_9NOCA|nr:MFS transporter [Williamsia sterculiae]SIR64764.1 drug resistance transporter, EmrB/QacA subfamily [Williamsia sterculiae]
MCLALVLVVASVSALNLALPDLAVSLGADNTALTWIADAYTVALAALVLPLGAIGDRLGRRSVLIAGCLVFGVSSSLAAQAGSPTTLIICRIAMGVGAAMIMPGTLSTITATFPADQRSRGVATWSGFAAAGAILGMLAAGGLLERWGWESIFYASAGVAVVAAVAAAILAPNTKDSDPAPFDTAGSVFTAVGIGTLVFAIIEGSDQGWTSVTVLATAVVCVIAFAAYAVHGLRAEHPLLDPHLFALHGFRAGTITVVTQFMAIFGFFFVGLQFLQLILDYSPLISAVALIPVAVVVLPTSQITPRLVDALGLKIVMTVGLLLIAAALVWVSRLTVSSTYPVFLVGLVLAGLGVGLTGATGTAAIVGALSSGQQGVASAVNDTTREVGSALGIAIMGSVFSARYADGLPDLSRLPESAATAVRDSAAGGLAAAGRLGSAGSQLADAVRHAFIDGLSWAMLSVAIVLFIAAAGCLVRAPGRAQPTAIGDGQDNT